MKHLLLVLILTVTAWGRVIVVPDSASTIQVGLGMAGSGDTVLVLPGVYEEHITWPSVDGIKLYSANGPDSTVVDGQYTGTCLTMGSGGLTRETVVRGFTFRNGFHASGGVAGISCAGSASIVGNRVTRCNGIGVYLSSSASAYKPLLSGNEIDGCFKEIPNYNYGCGVYVSARPGERPEICRNYIHHDTLRNSARNYGGGIFCDADALIYQNRIEANVLSSDTGSSCRAYGAGIYIDMDCRPVVFSNLIAGNRCETDAWKYGAGIRLNLGAEPLIVSNTIVGNICDGPHMWSKGGGIYNDMRCTTYVKGNIIAGNRATNGSGIFNYTTTQNGLVVSLHNDYYDNTLAGCSMGTGDISQDPLFVAGPAGDHYLSQVGAGQPGTSPCVDAGDTFEMTTPLDLDSLLHTWTTRTDSGYDTGVLDMGYHYPVGVMVGVAQEPPRCAQPSVRVMPNPFHDRVDFSFRLVQPGEVELRASDVMGRAVFVLRRRFAAGERTIAWNPGAVPAGVYLYRLTGEGLEEAGRVVKLD